MCCCLWQEEATGPDGRLLRATCVRCGPEDFMTALDKLPCKWEWDEPVQQGTKTIFHNTMILLYIHVFLIPILLFVAFLSLFFCLFEIIVIKSVTQARLIIADAEKGRFIMTEWWIEIGEWRCRRGYLHLPWWWWRCTWLWAWTATLGVCVVECRVCVGDVWAVVVVVVSDVAVAVVFDTFVRGSSLHIGTGPFDSTNRGIVGMYLG